MSYTTLRYANAEFKKKKKDMHVEISMQVRQKSLIVLQLLPIYVSAIECQQTFSQFAIVLENRKYTYVLYWLNFVSKQLWPKHLGAQKLLLGPKRQYFSGSLSRTNMVP